MSWKHGRLYGLWDGVKFCVEWHFWMVTVVKALFLTCHSSVPTEGGEEGSRLVQVTTQRIQRTSPPLGGYFRIQLPTTVIPGKGAIGVHQCLISIFRGIPRQTASWEIVRQGDSLKAIYFPACESGLKIKDLDNTNTVLLLKRSQLLNFVDVETEWISFPGLS